MSLTNWVEWDRELIDKLFNKPVFNSAEDHSHILKAEPLTKNYGTIGTAFDYAMRLMLAKINQGKIFHYITRMVKNPIIFSDDDDFPITADYGAKAKKRKDFIKDFLNKKNEYIENRTSLNDLLSDCIILAKMETIYRSGKDFPDSDIFSINNDDITDLQNLIGIVDISKFIAKERLILNPIFGNSSAEIGGADADFIIDDRIIDIKVTKA
jgi:hypothetical protein